MLKSMHIHIPKHQIEIILPIYISKVKNILNKNSKMPQAIFYMNWRDLKANSKSRVSAAAMWLRQSQNTNQLQLFSWYTSSRRQVKLLGRKAITNLNRVLKNRDITLPTKVCYSQRYGFSSSHVRMWELDHKEGWLPKNWCLQTVVLEKILESPLEQGDQSSQS